MQINPFFKLGHCQIQIRPRSKRANAVPPCAIGLAYALAPIGRHLSAATKAAPVTFLESCRGIR